MRQFHVGGSINIKHVDIFTELTNLLDSKYIPIFKQQYTIDKQNLISNEQTIGKIIINKEYYHDPKDMIISNESIKLNFGYFTIDNGIYQIEVAIDNKIEIPIKDKTVTHVNETTLSIGFNEKQIVFSTLPTPQIFSKQVKIIDAMFSGKQPYKDADHFCMKVYTTYLNLKSGADMVHFEVLASNLLRDSKNPSYPARLNPTEYRPVIMSLNSIPKYESWLQAFAFQDPKDAIMTGLLYPRQEKETIIEKLISGNF